MSKQSLTQQARDLVAQGLTPYAAAQQVGISPSNLYNKHNTIAVYRSALFESANALGKMLYPTSDPTSDKIAAEKTLIYIENLLNGVKNAKN